MKQLNTPKIYILVILCYTNKISYLQYCVKIVRYSLHFFLKGLQLSRMYFDGVFSMMRVSSHQKYTP